MSVDVCVSVNVVLTTRESCNSPRLIFTFIPDIFATGTNEDICTW
jgi:hypothetical protein